MGIFGLRHPFYPDLLSMQRKEEEVYDAIQSHFACDKRRIKFIAYLIVALLKLTNCSLSEWSRAVSQSTQRASRYKRLQRFVGSFQFSARLYARLVWSLYGKQDKVVLTLDRTEYQMRGEWIQVLMLSIAHQGISIPLLWHTRNRRGNASAAARASLVTAFRQWLPLQSHQQIYLTADREFVGADIRQAGLIPIIRIRANAIVTHQGQRRAARTLFETTQWRKLRKPRLVYQQRLYLAGVKLPDNDYLILVSDRYLPNIAALYAQRWEIETLFGAYKSRGFQWEQCRLTHHQRIHTMLFVLAITLIWAIRTGEWLVKKGQTIPLKKLKTGKTYRKLLSLFRHGLDHLQDLALNQSHFHNLTSLLSCT